MDVQGILSRIENRLKEIGMSKEEFYKLSGISSATYSYWNTGKYKPTSKKLRPAAAVLGIDYLYLLTGEEQKEKPALVNESGLSAKQSEFLSEFFELSNDQQEIVLRLVKEFKASNKGE